MKRIVILTGSELRHTYLRKAVALNPAIEVLRSYCEGAEKGLRSLMSSSAQGTDLQLAHIEARERSEEDFFGAFVYQTPDISNPSFIAKGTINDPQYQQEIIALNPDLLIAYGCSLIKEPLLSAFNGRFLNVHLGISPYYRGSGTNFWALVNGEPEFVGATFMYIDAGIDTGAVIHQIRARIFPNDTPHQIGNRLICDVAREYTKIINNFGKLEHLEQLNSADVKCYRQKDFSAAAVERLYENFQDGLVEKYLSKSDERNRQAAILTNPVL